MLAVIRLTAVQPRLRGRGFETADQAAERGKFDVALVAVLSDAGLRRSEASSLTWGDVQRWDDGSGRITVVRSKTDVEARGAVVAITPTAMQALDAIRPVGAGGEVKVFGLSESQIARRVKVIAKAAGLTDWEFFSGHSGRVGMARRMAQNGAPTHEIERQGRWKQGGGMVGRYTRGESAGSALRYLCKSAGRKATPLRTLPSPSLRLRGHPHGRTVISRPSLESAFSQQRHSTPYWSYIRLYGLSSGQ